MGHAERLKRAWWWRLAAYAKPHRRTLAVLGLLSLMQAGIATLQPWPIKLVVDNVLMKRPLPESNGWLRLVPGLDWLRSATPTTQLMVLAGFMIVLGLCAGLIGLVQTQLGVRASKGMLQDLRGHLFDHLQRLSTKFHGKHAAGDLIRRVLNDCGCVENLVMSVGFARVDATVRVLLMFFVLWQLNQSLTMIILIGTVPLGLISRFFYRGMTERSKEEYELGGEMTALAEQTLSAVPVVQGFGREDHGDERFASVAKRSLQAALRVTASQLLFAFGTGAVRSVVRALVIFFAGLYVLQGEMTVGGLLVFLSYQSSLTRPLEGMAWASVGFAGASAGAARIFEVMDADDIMRDAPDAQPLAPRRAGDGAQIRLERVSFGYASDRPVLRDVTLSVRAGETVALVGATGAGKSTLVSLVPRFFDPGEGRVTVQGTDVRSVQLKSLRSQIAIVLQESFILPISFADNIAYGRPDASRAEIEAVARAANAHVFIEKLPKGYDTVVGERGATLSGGERQRLAIARAFLKDAPILILDEPTSALDVGTEKLILDALDRLMRGRTTLVIAHRLSTARRADRIVVLDHGQIVEVGSHEELMADGGSYSEFWRTQHGPAAPALSGN